VLNPCSLYMRDLDARLPCPVIFSSHSQRSMAFPIRFTPVELLLLTRRHPFVFAFLDPSPAYKAEYPRFKTNSLQAHCTLRVIIAALPRSTRNSALFSSIQIFEISPSLVPGLMELSSNISSPAPKERLYLPCSWINATPQLQALRQSYPYLLH
jgi:hypothetical protein